MKKAALIHDLSGIGRCSLNAAITVTASMGIQPCPLPTAILSNQTGFESFSFLDFTPYMKAYYEAWKKIGYTFDVIYSGFLGSKEQIDLLMEFMLDFKQLDTLVLIDPVMGDNGELYPIYNEDYPEYMKRLVEYATIITPNMTEFSLLTGYDYKMDGLNRKKIYEYARVLSEMGPKQIVITGLIDPENPDRLINLGIDFNTNESFEVEAFYNGKSYSGTGDLFASVLCGCLTRGDSLRQSVYVATDFISKAVTYTSNYPIETTEGIMYEIFLKELSV